MGMSRTGVIEVVLERLLAEVTEDATGIDGLIAGLQNSISQHEPLTTDELYNDSGLPR